MRDVHAGDQQDEGNRSPQQQECGACLLRERSL
jgi:hypothetical protein